MTRMAHTYPVPSPAYELPHEEPTGPDGHQLRIHLLGPLQVVRPDGTRVGRCEWKTGKTMDLLRLLAIRGGQPVRTQVLIDRLWPQAPPERARGSLRTAASQIRRAVHDNCLVREPGTVALRHAWVDVVRLNAVLAESRAAMAREDPETVVACAETAEALYHDDFHAYDDESDWARVERDFLSHARVELLTDAAECCLTLRRHRRALELAQAVLFVDPTIEAAHRTMMRAHAELGEIGSALRVFDRYRRQLAQELGVDPSAQTRELHLQLLRDR